MNPYSPEDISELILGTLLEKWENSTQRGRQELKRSISLLVDRNTCGWYFDERDPEPRHLFIRVARELESQGIVSLRWGKGIDEKEIVGVSLNVSETARAYLLIGRNNPDQSRLALQERVSEMVQRMPLDSPAWYRAALADFTESLSSPILKAGPVSAHQEADSLDTLTALEAIAAMKHDEMIRSFSARLFGDSKRLSAIASRVASVLRKHDPELQPAHDSSTGVLQEYGILRKEAVLLVRGPITFQNGDTTLYAGDWKPFIGIPEDIAVRWPVTAADVRSILTVENEESFSSVCQKNLPEGILVLYTGGFSNRGKVAFLKNVDRATGGKVPIVHWGDLDLGGFRILLHLRENVRPDIRLLFDDPRVIGRLSEGCNPMPAGHDAVLLKMAKNPLVTDIFPFILAVAEQGKRIEQESIDPAEAIEKIIGLCS